MKQERRKNSFFLIFYDDHHYHHQDHKMYIVFSVTRYVHVKFTTLHTSSKHIEMLSVLCTCTLLYVKQIFREFTIHTTRFYTFFYSLFVCTVTFTLHFNNTNFSQTKKARLTSSIQYPPNQLSKLILFQFQHKKILRELLLCNFILYT